MYPSTVSLFIFELILLPFSPPLFPIFLKLLPDYIVVENGFANLFSNLTPLADIEGNIYFLLEIMIAAIRGLNRIGEGYPIATKEHCSSCRILSRYNFENAGVVSEHRSSFR